MPCSPAARHFSLAACRRNSTPQPVPRSKEWRASKPRLSLFHIQPSWEWVLPTTEHQRPTTDLKIKRRLESRPIAHPEFSSQHLHARHMDRLARHLSAHGNVMSFVPLERVRVLYIQDLLVAVRYHDHFLPGLQALFGAGRRTRVRSFDSALRICDPAFDGVGFIARKRYRGQRKNQAQHYTHREYF